MAYLYDYQNVYSNVLNPSYYIFADYSLDVPTLSSPASGNVTCIRGSNTVTLEWSAVGSATHYIVQWCRNSEFVGPTMGAKKVSSSIRTLALALGTDIKYGNLYYWRVFAFSTTGGASPKSDVREFTIKCDSDKEQDEDPRCEDFDVNIEFIAPDDTVHCGEAFVVFARYSFDNGTTLSSVTWEVDAASGIEHAIIYQDSSKIVISTEGCNAGDIDVKLTLNLVKTVGSAAYTCENTVSVKVDCETPEGSANFYDSSPPAK